MDSNTVFVRTSKGEDEAHSRTAHLPGDIRRALLVVDGIATFGELSKRAAPSLRANLGTLLQELEKDGYIRDKSVAVSPPKMAFQPKMVVPPKKAAAPKMELEAEDAAAGDLDFLTGFSPAPKVPEAAGPQPSAAEGPRVVEEEARAAEAARLKAQEEAARVLHEAEREKERIAAEARVREEARRAADEEKAARAKAELAFKARLEAEARAQQQAEAARRKAEQEAAAAHEAAEKSREVSPAPGPDAFTFEAFQIEESQRGRDQAAEPERKGAPMGPAAAGKTEAFVFEGFQVDTGKQAAGESEKETPARGQRSAAPEPVEMPQTIEREAPPAIEEALPVSGPSREEIERATQERIATERRVAEEALAARKQAEAEDRARAEARKRAEEAARAQLEEAARTTAYPEKAPAVAKSVRVARPRPKPITGGRVVGFVLKAGFALAVLLLGVLFAAPYAVPTRDYIPAVEKFLSARLGQTVHIGRLSGRILPTPRLELGEVQIGSAKQLEVGQALINFAFKGLVIEAKPINSIELQGATVSGAGLQSVSAWLQGLAADSQYPVASIVLRQGKLDAGAVQLNDIEGTLNFGQIGEFVQGSLKANVGKYTLDMSAGLGGKLNVEIGVRDSALPLLPNWHFDELSAKGELSSRGLSVGDFHGSLLDGFLQGKASIDWRSGWLVQGSLVARTIAMQHLNGLLEGNVEGSARFGMSAARLDALADSAVLDGSFTSRKGLIHGVDVIETARIHSTEHLPGGRTHYDEMSGKVAYGGNTLRLKQVRLKSNVLDATAALDIQGQRISGSAVAKLAMEEGMKPATLRIDGTLDRPTLRFSR